MRIDAFLGSVQDLITKPSAHSAFSPQEAEARRILHRCQCLSRAQGEQGNVSTCICVLFHTAWEYQGEYQQKLPADSTELKTGCTLAFPFLL